MSLDFTQAAATRESAIEAVPQNGKRCEADSARNMRSETLSGLAQNRHEQVAELA
jgi:hypothetical protein